MNPYNTVDRRNLLERVMRHLIRIGQDAEANDLAKVIAVVSPDCPGCRAVHETFPRIRHFHSPICKDQGVCARPECQKTLIDVGTAHDVGLICGKCYGGDQSAGSDDGEEE